MNTYLRTWALDDIHISRSGDGRTVTAYAAMFDAPYEVRDQHGHYMESIERSAFNRTLSHGGASRVACLFNHGLTVHGTPDGKLSVPLGSPLEIKPDGRGLLTVTRYNRGEVADLVLESIRNGDIRSQSFRGRIFRSSPDRLPRAGRGGALPTVTRHELGLSDYGPTPVPVNAGAEIVAVRSASQIVEELEHLDDDEREELLEELARHLSGRHAQSSHGNRFNSPGDRSSGVRRKGTARKPDPFDDNNKRDDSPSGAAKPAKPAGRTFTNQDVLDVLGDKKGRVGEHLQTLKDAGATHDQAVKVLQDLHVKVDADPNAGANGAWTSNDVEFADFSEEHGWGAGGALRRRVEDDKRAEAGSERQQSLRDATPGAYARLLGEDGQPAMVTSKPVRAVVDAMRENGWTITGVGAGGGQYRWSSADGSTHLNMLTAGGTPKLYDERHNSISGKKALERVTGAASAAAPSPTELLAAARSLTGEPLAADDSLVPDEVLWADTATPDGSGPGAEDSPTAGHSGRLSVRRNRIRAELISLGVIKP